MTAPTSTDTRNNVKVVPNDKLYVSEPNPMWFGNRSNPTDDPSWTNKNWLKSRFHFSFAEYRNPKNSSYGVLRVLNDDLVQPMRGFGAHPHANMEIVTYIVNGKLTHEDSMGTSQSLGRGSIQFMTAGSGITHSEHNHTDKPLRFIQTWIVPERRGLSPNYGGYDASDKLVKNQVRHLASSIKDNANDTPVKLNQDVNCRAGELELGKSVSVDLPEGRQAYLLCVEGSLKVNGQALARHDACEITSDGEAIVIEAVGVEDTENGEVGHFLMFDMEEVEGSGRRDF
ncbi:unnamed protein product [Cylindrotheca closterium]|uniref:Pirin n=1 Tax=Cylindrotheca closterium TaxID=2856 RepID=A0AAD2G7L4_9STRA|nr:unnamed protein product [Cylindrotheca closterium]